MVITATVNYLQKHNEARGDLDHFNRIKDNSINKGDSKDDRRSFFSRCSSRFNNCCCCCHCLRHADDGTNGPISVHQKQDPNIISNGSEGVESWKCSFGTQEDDGVWMNRTDRIGLGMALSVWILMTYSGLTMFLLAQNHHIPVSVAAVYVTICALALACHAKTSFSDPGAIPSAAIPLAAAMENRRFHSMCSKCQTYKPDIAHHCRICNRCISRMDHHCPWMNNCVGVSNFRHFFLFLIYTWTGSSLALITFCVNYFFCDNQQCEFSGVEVHLVRFMTLLCIGTWLFVSSMLMNVTFVIVTGVGTIDRLKMKASNTWHEADHEGLALADIFGTAPFWTWWLPIDPVFGDHERMMGFSVNQRLLRERSVMVVVADRQGPGEAPAGTGEPSYPSLYERQSSSGSQRAPKTTAQDGFPEEEYLRDRRREYHNWSGLSPIEV